MRTSTIVPIPEKVVKYAHDLEKLKLAEPCLRAIIDAIARPDLATNPLERLGVVTLRRLFARAGS